MPRARSSRRVGVLTPLLVLVNAAAAGAVWLAATSPIDTSPLAVAGIDAASPPPGPSSMESARERAVPAASALSETLARPLFRADRRPPQPVQVVADQHTSTELPPARETPSSVVAPPPPLPEGLRLIGVASLPRKPARALLRTKSVRHGVWMAAGESVDGWRIAEIGSGEVWLEASGHRQLLSLEVSPPAPAREGVATRPE